MYPEIVLEDHRLDRQKYMLLQKIKQGGFGNVFLIQNKETHDEFAAKKVEIDKFNQDMIDQGILLRINMNHSTINKFIGFINYNSQSVLLIMEKFNNSLMDVLSKNKLISGHHFDNTARQIILVGVAYGMIFLHKNSVYHRSLTPESILLDENNYPYITDFEFEKPLSQSFKVPIYTAPEYFKKNEFNDKSDVYSFGIIMYQIITNKDPFPQVSSGEMSEDDFKFNVVRESLRPKIPSNISWQYSNLLSKCWSDDPNERPSFNDIYKKLYYDFSYYLDDVDTNKLFKYVSLIEIGSQKENSKRENHAVLQNSSISKMNKTKLHSHT